MPVIKSIKDLLIHSVAVKEYCGNKYVAYHTKSLTNDNDETFFPIYEKLLIKVEGFTNFNIQDYQGNKKYQLTINIDEKTAKTLKQLNLKEYKNQLVKEKKVKDKIYYSLNVKFVKDFKKETYCGLSLEDLLKQVKPKTKVSVVVSFKLYDYNGVKSTYLVANKFN